MPRTFNLVERAQHRPFQCVVCHTHPTYDNPALDLNIQIDYYGMVYLCSSCIANVAHHMGYMHPKEASNLLEEVTTLRDKIGRIPAVTERLVNDIRDLSIAATADLLAEPTPIVLVDDTHVEPSNEGVNLDYFGADEPVEPSSEPAGDERPASVPASSGSNGATKKSTRNSTASNG